MIELIGKLPDYQFVLHPGDFAYADEIWTQYLWDVFGRKMEKVMARQPYVFTIGNHEMSKCANENFNRRFTKYPGQNTGGNDNFWYTFTYSYAHFIILSSNHPFEIGSPQYEFIIKSLEKVDRTKTPWLFVSFHHPIYSSNSFYPPFIRLRNVLDPLLQKYKVDFVICGHVHAYERTCNVFNEKCGNGPIHLKIGSAGRHLYRDWNPKPIWSMYRESEHGIGRFHVSKTRVSFEFLRVNYTIGDKFMIEKNISL